MMKCNLVYSQFSGHPPNVYPSLDKTPSTRIFPDRHHHHGQRTQKEEEEHHIPHLCTPSTNPSPFFVTALQTGANALTSSKAGTSTSLFHKHATSPPCLPPTSSDHETFMPTVAPKDRTTSVSREAAVAGYRASEAAFAMER